jgi:hypothetical protein
MNPVRPLADIQGHEREIGILRKIAGSDLQSASFLLWGPDGVGKKSAALALAREILCGSENRESACGGCESCRIPLSRHPDFRFLDTGEELSIGIDRVRGFCEGNRELPLLSPLRVGVVDEAHRLTPEAANALLKIVEEPPGKMLYFFVTSLPDRLLPTLRSRLIEIRFKPLGFSTLVQIARSLFPDRSQEEVSEALPLSGGSVTRLDQLLNPSFREGQEKIRQFLESFGPDSPADQRRISEAWSTLSEKEGFDQFLDSLERLLLSCEHSLAGAGIEPSWSGSPLPRHYAGGMSDFRRSELHDRIGEMRRMMVHNINRGLALEQFLWSLDTSFRPDLLKKQ